MICCANPNPYSMWSLYLFALSSILQGLDSRSNPFQEEEDDTRIMAVLAFDDIIQSHYVKNQALVAWRVWDHTWRGRFEPTIDQTRAWKIAWRLEDLRNLGLDHLCWFTVLVPFTKAFWSLNLKGILDNSYCLPTYQGHPWSLRNEIQEFDGLSRPVRGLLNMDKRLSNCGGALLGSAPKGHSRSEYGQLVLGSFNNLATKGCGAADGVVSPLTRGLGFEPWIWKNSWLKKPPPPWTNVHTNVVKEIKLKGVTLVGTEKETGDRHPKIGQGALIGGSVTILGNIKVGKDAIVSADSLVMKDVPLHNMVTGIPAKVIGYVDDQDPSLNMKHGDLSVCKLDSIILDLLLSLRSLMMLHESRRHNSVADKLAKHGQKLTPSSCFKV
ncbi:hypothetical protein FXO38_18165 [Capsicum annuum]|nr:hypothetical protein FXO38_18165 [Capsicum annuum]